MPSSDPTISSAPSTRYAPSSSPSISLAPSTLPSASPSNMPSESPFCPPPGEDPNDWVDCFEGYVRGTNTPCEDVCGDQCCQGFRACQSATACIKKDGSCNDDGACQKIGYGSSYELLISGPSCDAYYACDSMFYFNQNPSGGVISMTNSCLCDYSCFEYPNSGAILHCYGTSPVPLDGLPACGSDIINVVGQASSACAVSYIFLCSSGFPLSGYYASRHLRISNLASSQLSLSFVRT